MEYQPFCDETCMTSLETIAMSREHRSKAIEGSLRDLTSTGRPTLLRSGNEICSRMMYAPELSDLSSSARRPRSRSSIIHPGPFLRFRCNKSLRQGHESPDLDRQTVLQSLSRVLERSDPYANHIHTVSPSFSVVIGLGLFPG